MSKSPTKSWQGLQRCALVTLSSTEHPWQTLKKTFYRFKWCPVVFTRQATHAGFFRKAAFPNTSKRTGRRSIRFSALKVFTARSMDLSSASRVLLWRGSRDRQLAERSEEHKSEIQ